MDQNGISHFHCCGMFIAMKIPSVTPLQSKGALIILSMAASADPQIVQSKITSLVNVGLGPRWKEDEDLARYSCIALQKLAQKPKDRKTQPTVRYPSSHSLFQKLAGVVLEDSNSTPKWFPAAEQAVNAIYALAEQPDSLCTPMIKQLTQRVAKPSSETSSSTHLSKLLFVVGHVALKHLQYLDDIQTELTRRKTITENCKSFENLFPLIFSSSV
jgi:condensin complex subunit 1